MASCYVIEPDRPSVLGEVCSRLPGLEPAVVAALREARLQKISIWPGEGRCLLELEGGSPLSPRVIEALQASLATQFTHVNRVEVRFQPLPGSSPSQDLGDPGFSPAAHVPAPQEAPEPLTPPAPDTLPASPDPEPPDWEDDDDEYERFLMSLTQKQANGAANGVARASKSNGAHGNGGAAKSRSTRQAADAGRSPAADPSVIKGRPIKDDPMPISSVDDRRIGGDPLVLVGQIFRFEVKEMRRGQKLVEFDITDRTDSITCKCFEPDDSPVLQRLREGLWVRVRGRLEMDRFQGEAVLSASDIVEEPPRQRVDDAPEKRVELHQHTKMSSLDGVAEVGDVIRQAAEWGHPAIAITDHGVVHAFPEAYQAAKKAGIKVIYGMEGYLVEDPSLQSRTYHIVILARNRTGLRNLYRLVSLSHLEYFYRKPRIPRAELERYREGLIIGSACEAGELYQAFLQGKSWETLKAIASFYDYLEIQPLANTRFLVEEGKVPDEETLRRINRDICRLAQELNKPVVATGDVHFLHPEDEIFRRILMAGHGFEEPEHPTPLYLRTTREMLEEFAYLGEELAYQVVVKYPQQIAEQCEMMPPVPEGLHPPRIEGAEETIREMAWTRAKQMYGDPLPPLVQARLEQELKAIVDNGFASLYLIAHQLVTKSLQDGYLVGSRGSVGSSLVATLCQITEVNPLPPHYRCAEGHFVEFFQDGRVGAGADLPHKPCPRCGRPLIKDGFDIPFEVFMGFHGEKVPDIDLNFSGEYQAEIHRYAETLLGPENVYRAGTIATVAERTAFGYVRNYLESKGLKARSAEINRLVKGCTGVRRTTGQHPGGLMVVPKGREIYEFTPVQRPANDRNSPIITTHFDYHAIHDQLVKLDLLGHDDPTMLRLLSDLTGIDVKSIPLDDPATLSIFSGVQALGVSPEAIRSRVGTLGIPEFGTRFVRQMLEETRPKNFSELVRISGFSHGTNVWANNAQDLIREGIADLSQAIATRDDIMIYLIRQGMEPAEAFRIMEKVRKGKGLSPEDEQAMESLGVPRWYIDSCNKITYMFPKAHAVAYVMMAFRIAYFKVHYPLAYYAAYFTVNAEHFDADLVLQGETKLRRFVEETERRVDASAKDKARATVGEVTLEAMARGIRFLRVDLYRSHPTRFTIEEGALRPPLMALQGVGSSAAESIAAARNGAPFTSIEDLLRRSGVTRAVAEALKAHGALGDLPETDQLQLF